MVFKHRNVLGLQLSEELMAAFARAAVCVCEDCLETLGNAEIGTGEGGKVFAGGVEELDAAGGVNVFDLRVLGELPPGDVGVGIVFAEAGDDA